MAQQRKMNIEPIAITASVTNLLNCNITSLAGPIGYTQTQPFILITHMRVINRSPAAVVFSLWKGATGASVAGTEFAWSAVSVPANGFLDWYSGQNAARFDAADFLTGLAASASALTLNIDAEIGLAG
jgi:hypothetical protein